ncbi:MAG: SMC-Scp complex subunit ScpB [Clostridiales bacterium]|nr:SMC-Scp complex subunit ScpB [Clostridiales bacterium]
MIENRPEYAVIECLLFVAGDPVPLIELARVLALSLPQTQELLAEMETAYRADGRGILPLVTDATAQLISNRDFAAQVEELLQPNREKTASQSLMETLSIVAYRQPVTRLEVESIRGVRSEYAIAQLQKMGLIDEVGRKEALGRPILYGTTESFLRKFRLHNLSELPDYARFAVPLAAEEEFSVV